MTVIRADWIPKPPPVGRLRRLLLRVTGPLLVLLVASLFTVSFWLSWTALVNAATKAEIPHPTIWPWAVDGFILAMALMVVQAKQLGGDRWDRWGPRLGMVAATGLSTWIQYAYAPHDPWLHAWSPLAVLFSFECLIRLSYGAAVGAGGGQRDQEVRGGPPGETADGVPFAAGATQPSRLVRGTPPPSTVPSSGHGGHGPDTGGVSLTDRDATVTPSEVTVPSRHETLTPAPVPPAATVGWTKRFDRDVYAALSRRKDKPERFEAYITERGLDRDTVMEMARDLSWPVANGHKEATPV